MKKILVKVGWEEIAIGTRGKCRLCPVALAIQKVLGISVIVSNIVCDENCKKIADLPTHVIYWIAKFDMGKMKVIPFEFELEYYLN